MNKILRTLSSIALASALAIGSFAGWSFPANAQALDDETVVESQIKQTSPDDVLDTDDNQDVLLGDYAGYEMSYDGGLATAPDDEVYIYDSSLYYLNQIRTTGADPGAMYVSVDDITDTYNKLKAREAQFFNVDEEAGEVYTEADFIAKYGTLQDWIDEYGNTYYVVVTGCRNPSSETAEKYPDLSFEAHPLFKSNDLNNWQLAGALDGYAGYGTKDAWFENFATWAPEFKRDPVSGMYLMYSSLGARSGNQNTQYNPKVTTTSTHNQYDNLTLTCWVANRPTGPYYPITADEYYQYVAAIESRNFDGTYNYKGVEDENGDTRAVYRDDIFKVVDGEKINVGGEYLTYIDEYGEIMNQNKNYVELSNPMLNFAWYNDEIRNYADFKFPSAQYSDRAMFAAIDINPVIDSHGDMYLYFSQHVSSKYNGNSIWCIKMQDIATPVWDTLTHVTTPSIAGIYHTSETDIVGIEGKYRGNEGTINEGCFVYEYQGWYYMTYSPFGYGSRNYSLYLAIANNPYGPFVKIPEFSPIVGLGGGSNDFMAGTGHHCFIEAGDELYALYHCFYNPINNGPTQNGGNFLGRGMGVDKVTFQNYDVEFTWESVMESCIAEELYYKENQLKMNYKGLTDEELEAIIRPQINQYEAQLREAFETCNDSGYVPYVGGDTIIPMMYGNGPTYSLQPLPEVSLPNGYVNVATKGDYDYAKGEYKNPYNVSVELLSGIAGTEVYANDEMITYQTWSRNYEVAARDELKLKFSWAQPMVLKNVMIYESMNFQTAFTKVKSIVFKLAKMPDWLAALDDEHPLKKNYNGYCYIKDLAVDDETFNKTTRTMRQGGAAIATFDEIVVDEVYITISAKDKNAGTTTSIDTGNVVKLSEVIMLGKVYQE